MNIHPSIDELITEDRMSHTSKNVFDLWIRCNEKVKEVLISALLSVGTLSAKYPWKTVLLSVLVSFSFVTIGIFTNFRVEIDTRACWTYDSSNTKFHGDWLYSEESQFPQPNRVIDIIIHSKGKNVLGLEGTRRSFDALDAVRVNTPNYNTVCFLKKENQNGECPITSPTGFWENHNSSLFESTVKTEEEVLLKLSGLTFSNGVKVVRENIYGKPYPSILKSSSDDVSEKYMNVGDNDMLHLKSASAMRINIILPPKDEEGRVEAFEKDATDKLFALQDKWDAIPSNDFFLELRTERSWDDEMNRGINKDIPYMAIAFNTMGIFCAIVLAKWDKVKSQSLLGAGAVVTVFLAIMTGYGLNFILGIPFTPLAQLFPYVMVGIGLDDTFILTQEFQRTDPKKEVSERIRDMIKSVGTSISVSTLTTFFAFILGSISKFPALRWFVSYAGTTVLIDFFYQITFFLALVAIDDGRQKARRRDCCPCCILTKNRSAETNKDDSAETTNRRGLIKKRGDALSSMWESYISLLMKPVTKIFVILFFSALLGLGILGASKQSQQFDFRLFLSSDSYLKEYSYALNNYCGSVTKNFLAGCYFRDIDVSKEENQEQMSAFIDDMADLKYISSTPAYNWLEDFKIYQKNQTVHESNSSSSFFDELDVFLTTEPYKSLYENNVMRDERGFVTASRVYVVFDQLKQHDSKSQVQAYKDQIKVAEAQLINKNTAPKDWNIFSYSEIYYAWEIYNIIGKELVLTLILGLAVVFVISLIFIPHPIGAPVVTFIVGAIYIELLAALWAADMYINIVTALGLTMSIGLVVDYNMHIMMTYFEIQQTSPMNREDCVKKVLQTMGKGIFLGGFSTFLGVLPLSLTDSEFFRTFFVTFIAIVTLGSSHGLIFMPVVLSLIAPETKSSPDKAAAQEVTGEFSDRDSEVENTKL